MAKKENNALVPHMPRALQREVERQIDLMKAKAEVRKTVIDSGTETHEYAGAKVVEAAQFNHMMLQAAAQSLNGTYSEVEADMVRMGAEYRAFVTQCVAQHMVSMLRQAEEGMPVSPEVGLLARLGDGIAEIRDELDRTLQED